MGPDINTSGNELFPTLGPKGQLYFASDGHPGIGGLDIFEAARIGTENKWSGHANVGFPFNSQGNDYGMCAFDNKTGFLLLREKQMQVENIPLIYGVILFLQIYLT